MKLKLWGVRGSLPAPHAPEELFQRFQGLLEGFFASGHREASEIQAYLKKLPVHRVGGFGGNTPCAEIITDHQSIIIDAGSGLRRLGYELMEGPCGKGVGEVHLFFTHFHWDHLMGLPFFTPLFIPGNKIHIYAVQNDLHEIFKTIFRKPYFPVPLEQLGGKVIYHQIEPRKPLKMGEITLTPYELDHPDPCWGYRIEHQKKVLAYCVDTEASRVSPERMGLDLPLYQNVDLMAFDAQYTLMETMEKINWGHGAASIGLDIAMREGIKKVLFMHHDPASSDEKIAMAEAEAKRYYKSQLKSAAQSGKKIHEVEWSFAREDMCVEI